MCANDADVGAAPAVEDAAASGPQRLARAAVAVALLAVGGVVATYLMLSKPKAKPRPAGAKAALVTVRPLTATRLPVTVHAMGTVRPARRIVLAPRVAGQIVWRARQLIPGGWFDAGAPIVMIDPADYLLAVRVKDTQVRQRQAELLQRRSDIIQRAAAVTQAESSLKTELGQQAVARKEYELLGKALPEGDRDLVLRRPQLQAARAACESAKAAAAAAEAALQAAEEAKAAAEAAFDQAMLDLERTSVSAPFNALVAGKLVDEGSQVSPTTPLAELVGTDEYWVEAAVPVDELRWLRIPGQQGQAGSPAKVFYRPAWGPDAFRAARVLRLAASLAEKGRMALLIVAVPDPLCRRPENTGKPAMILDSYVRVELQGRELPHAVTVPRTALRDGDRVWIMKDDNTLEIRGVDIVRRGPDLVYVQQGLQAGERLVTSDLSTPVEGMALRLPQAATASAPATNPEGKP